jgi:hypothetical protein
LNEGPYLQPGLDQHPFHADPDLGFEIFADPNPGFEIFSDRDPRLDFSEYECLKVKIGVKELWIRMKMRIWIGIQGPKKCRSISKDSNKADPMRIRNPAVIIFMSESTSTQVPVPYCTYTV